MKARKKPIVIDYFDPSGKTYKDLALWLKSFNQKLSDYFGSDEEIDGNSPLNNSLYVKTLEGKSYNVTDDDYIIRGIKGEFYPHKKDIFQDAYDKIDDDND